MTFIKYSTEGYSIENGYDLGEVDTDDHPDDSELRFIAEEAAEDFHSNHDGWESTWPLDIELYANGESLGVFSVEREYDPVFSASKKEAKP